MVFKKLGTGGMASKVRAAKYVTNAGIPVIIANGRTDKILTKIINGEDVGTFFVPKRGCYA